MKRLIFLLYVVVEIAVFWVMAAYLGVGWAIIITVAAAAVGVAALGTRARNLVADVQRASRQEIGPGRPLTDSALFAFAALAVIVPGVVSTVLGLLLMAPPVRRLFRPLVAAAAAKRVMVATNTVDGAVIDSTVGGPVVPGTIIPETIITETTVRNPDGTVVVEQLQLPPAREY